MISIYCNPAPTALFQMYPFGSYLQCALPFLQVSLRWIYEQGVTSIAKSYNMERLKQNLEIFDWELTDEDRLKISQIPQKKVLQGPSFFSQEGEFTSVDPEDLNVVE